MLCNSQWNNEDIVPHQLITISLMKVSLSSCLFSFPYSYTSNSTSRDNRKGPIRVLAHPSMADEKGRLLRQNPELSIESLIFPVPKHGLKCQLVSMDPTDKVL